jgi:hypothetical protein
MSKPVITYAHSAHRPPEGGLSPFAGMGIVKWCAICGTHKPQGGGFLKHVFGSRHWVCQQHPKAGAK